MEFVHKPKQRWPQIALCIIMPCKGTPVSIILRFPSRSVRGHRAVTLGLRTDGT